MQGALVLKVPDLPFYNISVDLQHVFLSETNELKTILLLLHSVDAYLVILWQ